VPLVEKSVVQPPVISSEIRKPEEKKDELVQAQTSKTPATIQESPSPVPQQSDERKAPEGVQGKNETVKEERLAVTEMQTGLKPTENKMANDASTASRALFGFKVLKENAFLYAEEKETSTKKWWFAKGTIMSIRQPGTEGWWRVMVADGSERGGWIQSNKLEEKK
jgi:hypothetical protein